MKLSNQAMGTLMMVLQKCLQDMNFQVDPEDSSHSTLVVTNPPVVKFEGLKTDSVNEFADQVLEDA